MTEYPIKTPEQFGPLLRGFRKEQNLSQTDVGDRAGLAQNAVSQIETDAGRAGLIRIFRVLAALNLELVLRRRKPAKHSEW